MDTMNSANANCSDDGQHRGDGDAEITLHFDDNSSLKTSKSALEAAPPRLQTALYECRSGGSMKLSKESFVAWEFVLGHMESRRTYSSFSDKIKDISVDSMVGPVNSYQDAISVCFIVGGSGKTVSSIWNYTST